ncbi:MAG: hypothetical protein M3Q30_14495 [Actinomycetota bacterium]|nr:hypothetical protein [Actinomycetota bacterium]
MTRIDEAVRHDLANAPLPPPVERVRVRSRRRRFRHTATAVTAVAAVVVVGAIMLGSSRRTRTVNVNPTVSQTSKHPPSSTTDHHVTTSVPSRSGRISNGPLSRALEQLVAPLVPKGALLADAQDIVGDPPVAEVTYDLPTGQQLHIVRERLTKLPGSPEQLIRDPAVDSLTRLSTGSQLLRIGHSDTAQQVILGRPNGTMINLILWTPVSPTAPRPSEAQRKAAALATLDWLTTLVEQHLDNPSSDIQ